MEALLALILFIGMGAAVFLINALHKRWAWRDAIRKADIDMQIASLRRHADHAVQHRPRVRANGCAATPGHIKAAPRPEHPKPCGGGMCRHRADCADHHCPGRLAATLAGNTRT